MIDANVEAISEYMQEFELIHLADRPAQAVVCIVVVAFNRLQPLERLLRSLAAADYQADQVDLLVSIDGGPSAFQLATSCRNFGWPHGRFAVRYFRENLGLRKHVLACGDVASQYDAVIALEDDLVVSTQFYAFARSAIARYDREPDVAGISLYAPAINEMAILPFQAAYSSADVYALQSAQSWGQVWTSRMWKEFVGWYADAPSELEANSDMPERVYSWPSSSWKKFAMKYLVQCGKTWIYPYRSHSTNFSEIGHHNPSLTTQYQVALDNAERTYSMPPVKDLVAYDIFFERNGAQLEIDREPTDAPLVADLYGTRQVVEGPVVLATPRRLDREPLKEGALTLRPHEVNLISPMPGDDFGIYAVDSGERVRLSRFPLRDFLTFHVRIDWRKSLRLGMKGLRWALVRRFTASRKQP